MRQSVSLETRLDWCLGEAQEWVAGREQQSESDEGDDGEGLNVKGGVTTGVSGERIAGDAELLDMAGTGGEERQVAGDGVRDSDAPAADENQDGEEREEAGQLQQRQGAGGVRQNRRWILKPSTLNKGAGLALGEGFQGVREAVHGSPDIREWVLQEYIGRPLLAEGCKFHLRAYALAGARLLRRLFQYVFVCRG